MSDTDFYKNVMNVIYQDSHRMKDAFINSVFHGHGAEVIDPKFIGKGAYAQWFCVFLNAIGQWCKDNEGNNSQMPETFLPENNPHINSIMNPGLVATQQEEGSSDGDAE